MFGEKALELIKALDRAKDSLPTFNDEAVRLVLEEMTALFEANREDVNATTDDSTDDSSYYSGVYVRHSALERNKRCLLAYLYHRLQRIRQMRWEFGSILPPEIRNNLCESESKWFSSYCKSLATYMRSIGDQGLNLTQDMKPPKSLYIEVRCVMDYGKFELEDGEVILLKRNSQHLLPRSQCENLIRQGVLQHVTL